jgi:mannose-6-phosphate isomerase-like protein (cupin superfamily)
MRANGTALRLVPAGALILAACGSAPHLLVRDPPRGIPIEEMVRAAPLAPGENIHPSELRRGENMSAHLVRIRDRERPHVHTRYDLAVVIVEGSGTLWLGGAPLPMRQGDSAFIPKQTPHYFVNAGKNPASALVFFSPPFSGPDQQPVD